MRGLATAVVLMLAVAPIMAPLMVPNAAAQAPAARVEAGRKLFQRCIGCHAVGPGAANVYGPQLNGIVGRKAGSVPGYAYSPAMKASGLTWDEPRLAAFIRDSERVVPGNKMRFFNFLSDKQAADIAAYLATQASAVPIRPPR